jgi:hypothetical protein
MNKPYTVLEIGSGSFKLHQEGLFSTRFQSSLGKGLENHHLNATSARVALENVNQQILPFLSEHGIEPTQVLVFATAAIREAMKDPRESGKKFIRKLNKLGFENIRIFSEEEECQYAARAVYEDLKDQYQDFLLLDTGGASHQLIEFKEAQVRKQLSFPIGSHSDLGKLTLPQFTLYGYNQRLPLVVIGTSGTILSKIPILNRNVLGEIIKTLEPLDIEGRRKFMKIMAPDKLVHALFVDFRLEILPNAFKIIFNCAEELQCPKFLHTDQQAMNYVSKHGFNI